MKRIRYINRHALTARLTNMTGENDWEHVAREIAIQILAEHAIERFKARQREAGDHDGR
jgi:hypothetical protein